MRGERIELAVKAAIYFLKSLPVGSFFNIISFGSKFDALFLQSQPYEDQCILKAVQSLNEFTADMGGTEIYDPLQYIFS